MDYNSDLNIFRGNPVVMEAFEDMMLSQEGRDKIGYVEKALEAVARPETQASMLDKLYHEVSKIDGVDFGTIPDSRGDITKYRYYQQLCDCMDIINRIVADGKKYPEVETMNKLHNVILQATPDFVFGFKTNNQIIMAMYKSMVVVLFQLSNDSIVVMTEHLRQKVSTILNPTVKTSGDDVVRTANQFIKMYESGQWTTMIKFFRSGKALEVMHEGAEGDPALEAQLGQRVGTFFRAAADLVNPMDPAESSIRGGQFDTGVSGFGSWWRDKAKFSGKAAIIIAAIIAALIIIRQAVYYFFHGASSLKDCLKNNAEILRANISSQSLEGPDDGIEKQKKFLSQIENTSDVIEYKVLKTKKAVKDAKEKADREVFNPDELKVVGDSGFEF